MIPNVKKRHFVPTCSRFGSNSFFGHNHQIGQVLGKSCLDFLLRTSTIESMKPIRSGRKLMFLTAGFICVGLGYLGMILPVMPSTIFFILALACFSRSSEKLEQWLLQHPWFGQTLRNWREHGTISVRAKRIICAFIGVSMIYTTLLVKNPFVLIGVYATVGAVLAFILTRPSEPKLAPIP